MAEPGGVLTRAGHTEAGCDLARLAGLEPSAVIVEVLNEDGSMARRPDLEVFAGQHGIKIGTIADLIQYRVMHEKTVERVEECSLSNDFGQFKLYAYQDTIDKALHLALVVGEIHAEVPTLIRVHVADSLCDLTGCRQSDCGWPLADAMRRIAAEGQGILVILRHEEPVEEMIWRIQRYKEQGTIGRDHPKRARNDNFRTYGLGAQILVDLGVKRMRVLSAPKKMHGISGFGLEISEYVS
jgi:3,4-dihydroxy 2-butanone 4-phosphate synthase/GTP cyclohydrolase II